MPRLMSREAAPPTTTAISVMICQQHGLAVEIAIVDGDLAVAQVLARVVEIVGQASIVAKLRVALIIKVKAVPASPSAMSMTLLDCLI